MDCAVGFGDGELEAVGEGGAGAGGLVDGDGGAGVAVLDEGPVFEAGAAIGLEGAVADELGVEAAVVGVVDLLGHEAVEVGADFGDGLGGVDGKGGALGDEGGGCGGEEECGEAGEAHVWESLCGITFTVWFFLCASIVADEVMFGWTMEDRGWRWVVALCQVSGFRFQVLIVAADPDCLFHRVYLWRSCLATVRYSAGAYD